MTNFDFFKSVSLLDVASLQMHELSFIFHNNIVVSCNDDSKSGEFLIGVMCLNDISFNFNITGVFDNSFIRVNHIKYKSLFNMRFRADELERLVPFFLGKYNNVQSFIRGFHLALKAINSEYNELPF